MPEVMSATERLLAAQISAAAADRANSRRNGVLCALIFTAVWLVAYPFADMPFIDDFSYTKTALEFARTGHFVYNGWATAMLGWMVPWGALFIKVFGFSFNVMRLSMLPIDLATVYVFHQVLRRFGITPQNAVLGALTMALSPLFLPLAASFMTDIPGVFVIVLCIYMCQRAVTAQSDQAALLWLGSATLLNVAGGTVRQIAWLGALIMVPSTAWLLRDKRGMKTAGILLFLFSFAGVLASLHWFNQQPYSVPEHIFAGKIQRATLVHLAAQYLKTCLCLLLVVFPVSVAWLPAIRRLPASARLRITVVVSSFCVLAMMLGWRGSLDGWIMPWLSYLLTLQGSQMPGVLSISPETVSLGVRTAISLLVVAPGIVTMEQMLDHARMKPPVENARSALWNEMLWILGPFSLSYVLLLAPRGAFSFIQDRYLLGITPMVIAALLLLYQEWVTTKLQTISLVALAAFAIYSAAGTHDFFSESRALVRARQRVRISGSYDRSIEASFERLGFAEDGWVQIADGGHVNDPRILVPGGAYAPYTPPAGTPALCIPWFASMTPSIVPKYYITSYHVPCLAPTQYASVRFSMWLPPFHRTLYLEQPLLSRVP
jgi:hypothetical protein